MTVRDLGERLLRHVPLERLPKLRTNHGRNVVHVAFGKTYVANFGERKQISPSSVLGEPGYVQAPERVVVTDPDTKGHLLALARTLWKDPYLTVVPRYVGEGDERYIEWCAHSLNPIPADLDVYDSEEEALVDMVVQGHEHEAHEETTEEDS
jgi:hypothetical protein